MFPRFFGAVAGHPPIERTRPGAAEARCHHQSLSSLVHAHAHAHVHAHVTCACASHQPPKVEHEGWSENVSRLDTGMLRYAPRSPLPAPDWLLTCSDVEANTRRKAMSRCLVLLLACVAAPTVVAKHQRTAQERLAQIWGWETGSVKVQHRAPKKEVQHRALWVSVAAAPTPTPHDGQ